MSKYNETIREIQEYIKNTEAKIMFNNGTKVTLPINHIGENGVAVKCRSYIKKNDIENAYPYRILEIIEDE